MEALTTFIIRSIVSEPDEVSVEMSERNGQPTLLVKVAECDRGSVIGRQGRTIRAIECVLGAAAGSAGAPGIEIAS